MRVSAEGQEASVAMSRFQVAIWKAYEEVATKHRSLTYVEMMTALNGFQSDVLKTMLRIERFNDTDKPGMSDEEWVENPERMDVDSPQQRIDKAVALIKEDHPDDLTQFEVNLLELLTGVTQ